MNSNSYIRASLYYNIYVATTAVQPDGFKSHAAPCPVDGPIAMHGLQSVCGMSCLGVERSLCGPHSSPCCCCVMSDCGVYYCQLSEWRLSVYFDHSLSRATFIVSVRYTTHTASASTLVTRSPLSCLCLCWQCLGERVLNVFECPVQCWN